MSSGLRGLGFRVYGFRGVQSLGFRGSGFRALGLGFRFKSLVKRGARQFIANITVLGSFLLVWRTSYRPQNDVDDCLGLYRRMMRREDLKVGKWK